VSPKLPGSPRKRRVSITKDCDHAHITAIDAHSEKNQLNNSRKELSRSKKHVHKDELKVSIKDNDQLLKFKKSFQNRKSKRELVKR
jgi:hypothetical protein